MAKKDKPVIETPIIEAEEVEDLPILEDVGAIKAIMDEGWDSEPAIYQVWFGKTYDQAKGPGWTMHGITYGEHEKAVKQAEELARVYTHVKVRKIEVNSRLTEVWQS